MSRYEMMARLLDGEHRLGAPWRLPKGAGFVLPLLGEPPFPERSYVLLQEVVDRVEFRDSGSIYGVEASNRSGRNVFVRRGTLLTGKGTQSRSPVSGVVLVPGKGFVTIPVNCVHQSHYISSGADFKAEGVAPHSVYQALGEQSATWESIAGYTRKMRSSARRMFGGAGAEPELEELRGVADDNLVDASAAVEHLQDRVEDALGKIPGDHVDQVGVAVFDLDGVVGVELFDHPDSWRAFSESIIRSYGEVLTREVGELYDIRMDRAEPVLRAFLQRAEASERAVITENSASKVYALRGEGVEGELACIEGGEIHLALARSESERGEGPGAPISMASPPVRSPSSSQEDHLPEEHFQEYLQRRGGYPVLDQLSERAQRFGELLRSVKVSRGTLATRLREAEDIGLVQKAIRKENGSPAYALTEEGKEAKKKGEEKVV
jgi:DNA-binding HxlR family transcriptional regulator